MIAAFAQPHASPSSSPYNTAIVVKADMERAHTHQHQGYGFEPRSPSGAASDPQAPTLPAQVFSSPSESIYPASTKAAIEATRARFFARQASGSRSAPRSRPTPTGSVSLSATQPRRGAKDHVLSSGASSSYRQSFFERCQRAMNQTRTAKRDAHVRTFRTGIDGATPGLFSDEMDQDEDSAASSPPHYSDGEDKEEDDELTRARILAEYARLKRIYELKGHLEIGWIDPDQLEWLEHETRYEELIDPLEQADDEQLQQLWIESQQPHTDAHDVPMLDDDGFDDPAFEQALAQLPY